MINIIWYLCITKLHAFIHASKVVLVSSTASIDEPPALPTLCIIIIPWVQHLAGTNHLLLGTAGGSVSARRGRRLEYEYRNFYYNSVV